MRYKILEQDKNESALFNILRNKGITDPYHYTHTTDEDINSPLLFGGERLQKAARMLNDVIESNSEAYIVVDCDCDGFTSSSLLGNWLMRAYAPWAQAHLHFYFHSAKQHGLADCIDFLEQQPIKLVICPDAASNDAAEQLRLAQHGISCFCLDHHNGEIDEDETPAIIISNNITYKGKENTYPNKEVSGVFVTWQFCRYLDSQLGTNYAMDYLDLVVLGDIADVMSLVNNYELRRILDVVEAQGPKNPLIQTILDKNEYTTGGKLTAKTCGWTLGPLINSVIRVGSLDDKRALFESFLEDKAYQKVPCTRRGHRAGEMEYQVVQTVRLAESLRRKQNKLRDQLVQEADAIVEDNDLLKNKILLVEIDDPTDDGRAITGLVANKLMSQYNRPVLLLNQTFDPETGELVWSGSARNNPLWGVKSLQELAKTSGDFVLAEGHSNAFGASLLNSSVKAFIDWSNGALKDYDFTPEYNIDLVISPNEFDNNDILELADCEDMWGQGLDEPLVLAKEFKLTQDKVHLYGTSTLKFDLGNGLSAIKFKSSQEEFARLDPGAGCITINIIGTCKRNTGWDNGPELLIIDYEIVSRQEYYF